MLFHVLNDDGVGSNAKIWLGCGRVEKVSRGSARNAKYMAPATRGVKVPEGGILLGKI
jgi:hypothetical protein